MPVMEIMMQQLVADAIKGNATSRRDVFKLMNFAEAKTEGWTVIHAKPVFPEEEETVLRNSRIENERLKKIIEELGGRVFPEL
jgi:hypothetical protein